MGASTEQKPRTKASGFSVWLGAKPYWERYLWRLHLEKDVLEEADLAKCYEYLLEDCDVVPAKPGRPIIQFPVFDLDEAESIRTRRTLNKIDNLRNVNAIDKDCIIEFGMSLTVIYGDNGAGKSGIGRLLSNACLSRKPRKLLHNARKATSPAPRPTADFHLADAGESRVIKYGLGDTHQVLRAFAVFDQECAPVHLNSENKVEFVPSKIQIFDEVFRSISAIEARLQEETDAKECEDPTEGIFNETSPITDFLGSLSHETTDNQIEDALRFTSEDKAALADKKREVTKKLKQDATAQKKILQEECRDLGTFKSALAIKRTVLSASKATQLNAVLKEIREKKGIVDKLSAKSFEFAKFKNVGSPEWKALIIAAHKLHEKELVSNGGIELEYCLLCRQALTGREKTLFGDYWKFLRSTAETELSTARRTLSSHVEALEGAETSWPAISEIEVAVKILKGDAPSELKKIKAGFAGLKVQVREWIGKIKKEQDVAYIDPKIDLASIDKLVADKRRTEAKLVDPTAQIRALNREIRRLEHKQQASRLIAKIKKYIAWLRWEDAANGINLSAVRGATTRKKTDIMGEIVMSQYVAIFNKETERLDCDFGLKVESHGRDANTIKGLKLAFAKGYNPSDILSEGEQTVSALADFLTEAKLDKNNSGIIFDDPVTSLDHERRSTIAKRLVEEARDRQVVVLTHDVVFLLDLQHYADRESIDCLSVSMRKNGDSVGLIKPELPWIAQDVRRKVGYLKNELPALRKAEAGDQDEYRNKVKLWYILFRESWERAVEERLFKGVVQRFNKSVQTQRLAKIEITDALIKEITDGMTDSSNWLHDMAAGLNPTVPKNAKLAGDLQSLEGFIAKCKPD